MTGRSSTSVRTSYPGFPSINASGPHCPSDLEIPYYIRCLDTTKTGLSPPSTRFQSSWISLRIHRDLTRVRADRLSGHVF